MSFVFTCRKHHSCMLKSLRTGRQLGTQGGFVSDSVTTDHVSGSLTESVDNTLLWSACCFLLRRAVCSFVVTHQPPVPSAVVHRDLEVKRLPGAC